MILINKAFMTVWKLEDKQKYSVGTTTTSDKQQDGTYKNSSWNVKYVGKAYEKSKELSEKSKIIVSSAKIENIFDKEKNRSWLSVIIFDFEIVGQAESNKTEAEQWHDDLPF